MTHPGEQQHAIGAAGLAEVMRRQHHGRAGGPLLGDEIEDALLRRQVETGDRLVEQQQVGFGGERLSNEHALALPTGERAERTAGEVTDIHPLGGGGDRPAIVGAHSAEQSARAVAPHPQHLADAHRHPAVLELVLGDERHDGPLASLHTCPTSA